MYILNYQKEGENIQRQPKGIKIYRVGIYRNSFRSKTLAKQEREQYLLGFDLPSYRWVQSTRTILLLSQEQKRKRKP